MKRFLFFPVLLLCVVSACSQAPAPARHYGAGAGAGSAGIHSVVKGDTLWSVSKRYKIVMRDIAIYNKLSPPFYLKSGQRLRLPPPREYKVKAGDTLYEISRLFSVKSSEVARLNDLQAPYIIHKEQILRLPAVQEKKSPVQMASRSRQEEGGAPVPLTKPASTSMSASKKPVRTKSRPKITKQTPKRSSDKFMKPVEGKLLSSYGAKKNGLHNDGINISAPKGAPVRAAENGIVVYSGNELKGSGNLVLVRHSDRFMTAYAHMDKRLIKRGDVIKRGQTIGTVGSTGSVDRPQLHFEVRRGTKALNPKAYM